LAASGHADGVLGTIGRREPRLLQGRRHHFLRKHLCGGGRAIEFELRAALGGLQGLRLRDFDERRSRRAACGNQSGEYCWYRYT
jgi:hypothetical protein